MQELDRHLVREGRHEQLWTVLGANVRTYPGELGEVSGTSFAVWAPNARAVRVVGDFNYWQGASHAMRSLGDSGVWEVFAPGVGAGARYKFEVLGNDGSWRQKADPLAQGTEVPPATASVVVESRYRWTDDAWLAARAARDPHTAPMSVYEVHLGSWRVGLSYRDLAHQLTEHVVSLGFTHVELLPVAEHPFGGSWGYQVSSYFAPTSRFGHPDDFRYLVDTLHKAGVGVIVDWVPAHFPKDEWSLAQFDGTPLYEHPDPLLGEHPDWGTYVFNFGRSEVRNFLVANATYWLEEFHVDGLRVDAVASMLYLDYSRKPGQWRPNQYGGRENLDAISFLQEANATAYRRTPGIMMIAEESTAWPGVTAPTDGNGLGFGLKWNMGWMNDTLRYLAEEPVHRRYHHNEITFSMVYAYSERFVLPISHDEVVHGKGSLYERMPGDHWQKLAGVRLLLGYQWTHPGKQLLFMGSEFAQQTEWAESRSLDWHALDDPAHQGVMRSVARPEPRLQGHARPLAARPLPRRVRVDRLRRRLPQHPRVPPQGRTTPRPSRSSSTSPASRTRATGSPCPAAVGGARSSTPTPRRTAAPASATSARSRPSPSPTTAARTPPRSASPRWASSSSRPADRDRTATNSEGSPRAPLFCFHVNGYGRRHVQSAGDRHVRRRKVDAPRRAEPPRPPHRRHRPRRLGDCRRHLGRAAHDAACSPRETRHRHLRDRREPGPFLRPVRARGPADRPAGRPARTRGDEDDQPLRQHTRRPRRDRRVRPHGRTAARRGATLVLDGRLPSTSSPTPSKPCSRRRDARSLRREPTPERAYAHRRWSIRATAACLAERKSHPRSGCCGKQKEPPPKGWLFLNDVRRRPTLPHPGECSTIGAEGLSFRVRNGTGRFPFAMTAVTLSSCQTGSRSLLGNRTVDAYTH